MNTSVREHSSCSQCMIMHWLFHRTSRGATAAWLSIRQRRNDDARHASSWRSLLALALVVGALRRSPAAASSGNRPPTKPTSRRARGSRPTSSSTPGKLTVGSDTVFPPLESMNGDVAEGFDVDLMTAIAKEMGLEVEVPDREFDTLIPTLSSRRQVRRHRVGA